MKFKKILFPTDGSKNAEAVVAYAIDLAKRFQAEVVILNVVEHVSFGLKFGLESKIEADLREHNEAMLKKTEEKLETENIKVRTKMVRGIAFEQIINTAEDENADLILMGTRGLSGMAKLLLGSVAERVAREAPCPVLLIPPGVQK